MTALPTRTDISGTPSKATAQAAFTAIYDYLAGLFGSTGTAATARAALGVDAATVVPSVASSALTLALKTAAGVDASATVPLPIPFRSSTLSSGTKNIRQVTAALSLVIPSTATLGAQSATDQWLYLYGLDNAGPVELAISGTNYGANFIASTSAIAAASNSATTIYSTTARASVPMTLLVALRSNQTVAGNWAAVPVEVTYPGALPPASGYTFPDNSLLTTAPSGFRNRIINGDHTVDQLNAGAAYTIVAGAARQAIVDMFFANCTGANVTGQQVTAADGTKRFRYTGAASVTAINHDTAISAVNSRDMAGQTCTLSAKLSNSLLTTVTWTAYYANTTEAFGTIATPTRTQIATGTFTVNATEATYAASFAVPTAATTGIEVVLSVGAQTSGTWTIGDVQLERGSIGASSIVVDKVDQQTQAVRCGRHRRRYTGGGVGVGRQTSTTSARIWFDFYGMHAVPVFGVGGTVQIDVPGAVLSFGATTTYFSANSGFMDVTTSAGGAIGYGCALQISGFIEFYALLMA
jgi:hypothetical protein